jgi:hypothetical protein
VQGGAIEGLAADWSRVFTDDGKQLQTVGHHFQHSRPLDEKERQHISRDGICLSCHKEIPDRSQAVNILHHVVEFAGQLPKTPKRHNWLVHKIMLLAGWVQVVAMFGLPAAVLVTWFWRWRRKRRRTAWRRGV